jgi:hypothetical protein
LPTRASTQSPIGVAFAFVTGRAIAWFSETADIDVAVIYWSFSVELGLPPAIELRLVALAL